MEELLSLKWNNHKSSFLHILALLRKEARYTDVTLACDGLLYKVHKVVLAGCSDYFSNIFESISSNTVIVLKDISSANLESLLDYMYLGEVSVRQSDLSSLIQAAECLKLKGLAVPDTETPVKFDGTLRSQESSPRPKKKLKKTSTDKTEYPDKLKIIGSSAGESLTHTLPTANISPELKVEELVSVKEETVIEPYPDVWSVEPDAMDFASNQLEPDDSSQYSDCQSSYSMTGAYESSYASNENVNMITSNIVNSPVIASSSQSNSTVIATPISCQLKHKCQHCGKTFRTRTKLELHIRTHTGEKPYVCTYCTYRSAQKGALTLHILTKHKNEIY